MAIAEVWPTARGFVTSASSWGVGFEPAQKPSESGQFVKWSKRMGNRALDLSEALRKPSPFINQAPACCRRPSAHEGKSHKDRS